MASDAGELRALLPGVDLDALLLMNDLDTLLKQRGLKLGQRLKVKALLRRVENPESMLELERPASPEPERRAGALDDLSAEDCEKLLESLLAGYAEPSIAAQLRALHAEPGSGMQQIGSMAFRVGGVTDTSYVRRIGALALTVQAPLLIKYGLPGDASGVARMKWAVHRRMVEQSAEGCSRLYDLSNEVRMVLGLTKLRNLAEEAKGGALELITKQINGEIEGAAPQPPTEAAMRAQITRARAAGTITRANAEYIEEELLGGRISPLVARSLLVAAKAGVPHASLSGRDLESDPLGPVTIFDDALPSASTFFSRHVLPGRPAVLRGAATESWPPLRDFADFRYLRKRCGHRRVLVKTVRLRDRLGTVHRWDRLGTVLGTG